jgi:hypothetical protein
MQPPSNGLVSLACRPILDFASSLHERREQGTCLSDRPLFLSGPELREADDHQDGADSRARPCVAILASLLCYPTRFFLAPPLYPPVSPQRTASSRLVVDSLCPCQPQISRFSPSPSFVWCCFWDGRLITTSRRDLRGPSTMIRSFS